MAISNSRFQNLRPELLFLLVAAFLAPIIGGHVATDSRAMFDSFLTELLGGGGLPTTTRFLLAIPIVICFALTFRRRIIQLPQIKILGPIAILLFALIASFLISQFKYVALRELTGWIIYFTAFFGVIANAGRQNQIRILGMTICAGISIAALKGIAEYISFMSIEPTHRIFADWTNPNAVASVFAVGTLLSIGLAAGAPSRPKLILGISAALSLAALILTQSKAGYLAFGVGFIAFLAFAMVTKARKSVLVPLAITVLGIVLALGLTQLASSQSAGAQALGRITAAGASAEQSVGFRQNLWKSALEISKQNPFGTGIGTFRQYSAQPGLTDQTVFAHQVYLQLLSEAGWAALIGVGLLAVMWFRFIFKGTKKQPDEINFYKAGVIGAVVAFGAHGLAESNLSFFGSGLLFFLLLGIGLQLSTDGTSPEALPINVRGVATAIFCLIPLLLMGIQSNSEVQKSNFQTALQSQDVERVRSLSVPLRANPMGDPEALYLGTFDPILKPDERLKILTRVVAMNPTPKYLRAAANQAQALNKPEEAIAFLNQVDRWDPSNLPARLLKLNLYIQLNQKEDAIQAAEALIDCEETLSYQVRAIPELVPTETFEGRIYLANLVSDENQKIQLLTEALIGFNRYKSITGAKLKQIASDLTKGEGTPVPKEMITFATESLKEYEQKMLLARTAKTSLQKLITAGGKPAELTPEVLDYNLED